VFIHFNLNLVLVQYLYCLGVYMHFTNLNFLNVYQCVFSLSAHNLTYWLTLAYFF